MKKIITTVLALLFTAGIAIQAEGEKKAPADAPAKKEAKKENKKSAKKSDKKAAK